MSCAVALKWIYNITLCVGRSLFRLKEKNKKNQNGNVDYKSKNLLLLRETHSCLGKCTKDEVNTPPAVAGRLREGGAPVDSITHHPGGQTGEFTGHSGSHDTRGWS